MYWESIGNPQQNPERHSAGYPSILYGTRIHDPRAVLLESLALGRRPKALIVRQPDSECRSECRRTPHAGTDSSDGDCLFSYIHPPPYSTTLRLLSTYIAGICVSKWPSGVVAASVCVDCGDPLQVQSCNNNTQVRAGL